MHNILSIAAGVLSITATATFLAVAISARLHNARMRKQQPWFSIVPEIAMENYYAYWEKQAGDQHLGSDVSQAA